MNNNLCWYALHVKTGYERDVAQNAMDGDVLTLLPIERYTVRLGGTQKERERVLLPGYCFVGCLMTPALWQRLRHEKGVLRILGDPFVPIPQEQMTNLMALYWHGINGTRAVRRDGVTTITEGPLIEVAHTVVCADARQGLVTVNMELPGGCRDVVIHAEFD